MPLEAGRTEAEASLARPTATVGVLATAGAGLIVSTVGAGVVVGAPAVAVGAEIAGVGAATAATGGVMVMNSSKNKSDGYERGKSKSNTRQTNKSGNQLKERESS